MARASHDAPLGLGIGDEGLLDRPARASMLRTSCDCTCVSTAEHAELRVRPSVTMSSLRSIDCVLSIKT